MRFGMPTLLELDGLEENEALRARLGLDFIELNMNLPEYQPGRIDAAMLRGPARGKGAFTFHLPEDTDLGHFNRGVRSAFIALAYESVEMAKDAGIDRMTMHMNPGVYFTMPEGKVFLYDKRRDEYLAAIRSSLAALTFAFDGTGVSLLIENTGILDRPYIAEAVDILLGEEFVGLTWDVGHDRSSGYADRAFMLERADRIRHVHLHDAIGESNHLPLFSGEIDIEESLRFARERGCDLVIETKTARALELSVQGLRERGLLPPRL